MLAGSGSWLTDQRKIGLGLTGFGMLFTILGMLMLFDRGLIAMGNLLFLAGLSTTIGLQSTIAFFMKRKNRKGSIFYLGGCLLVIVGWTVVGLFVEAYGFWLLFCEFIPTALQFFRHTPILNNIPFLRTVLNKIGPPGTLPTTNAKAH
mmetsp:Transcript_11166/g.19562  ORF Transcript_11166/g.19562 Transcript_11166/m.19562 type:complete len:148 (-) Transcript_11166:391-834(-)